jgi:hypothetical protein
MLEILRRYLSDNSIRNTPLVDEIAPDATDARCFLGRFARSGKGVGEKERFTLAMQDGRVYHIEVERVTGDSPCVVSFRTIQS